LTGLELWRYTQTLIDKSYSGFLDNTKANRLFRDATFSEIQHCYNTLDRQALYDQLNYLIETEVVYPITNNTIATAPLLITGISFAADMTVATLTNHNLTTGDTITLSGVTGTLTFAADINGTYVVVTTPTAKSFTVALPTYTGVWDVNSGVVTADNLIADYLHQLTIKATFSALLEGITITNATPTTPIVVTLNTASRLRDKDQVTLAGNTVANGTWYVKQLNKKKYALYTDILLQTASTGSGVATSGGTVTSIYTNYCTPYFSDRKISSYGRPSLTMPKFEDSAKSIKFYPSDYVCSSIAIDYIKLPSVNIDVADTVIDLSYVYNDEFLYRCADYVAKQFAISVKDTELYQETSTELIQNP